MTDVTSRFVNHVSWLSKNQTRTGAWTLLEGVVAERTLTRKRRDEVYNGLKASLEIIASAGKMSPVPGLEGIIGAVTSIMDIVEVSCYLKMCCSFLFAYHCWTWARG